MNDITGINFRAISWTKDVLTANKTHKCSTRHVASGFYKYAIVKEKGGIGGSVGVCNALLVSINIPYFKMDYVQRAFYWAAFLCGTHTSSYSWVLHFIQCQYQFQRSNTAGLNSTWFCGSIYRMFTFIKVGSHIVIVIFNCLGLDGPLPYRSQLR